MFLAIKRAGIGSVYLLFSVLTACTPSETSLEIKVSAEPEAKLSPSTPADMLAALQNITGKSGKLHDDVADVRLMLEAEVLDAQGSHLEASRLWFEALGQANGRFGQRALTGWIKSYTKNLGKKIDRIVLARLLVAETRQGAYSPYMRSRSLTNEDALIPLLVIHAAEWLAPNEETAAALAGSRPPVEQGIPPTDPLLTKTASLYCKMPLPSDAGAWAAWQKTLSPEVQDYWHALIDQCSDQPAKALNKLVKAHKVLAKQQHTQALAVEAASRAAVMQRALVQRNQAADSYLTQMKLWELPGVTPAAMGLDPLSFLRRHAEEAMWAARYRALIGDYENGKLYAHKALDLIANAYTEAPKASTATKTELASLRAEAYHILAYRIAVENREFQSALSLNLLALQTPYLNAEWRERLEWFTGVYDYLGGNFDGAKKKWEALLSKTQDDSLRAMLYYWLARAHHHLDQIPESRFRLKTIVEEYPLSYYATVAPLISGLKPEKDWREIFSNPHQLLTRLERTSRLNLAAIRQNEGLAPLLRRAEILVAADLGAWAKMAVNELETAVNAKLRPEAQPEAFVYLTRLHYSSGNYLAAIALTTKLTKSIEAFWRRFPEQILVYFPRPHLDTYGRNATDSGVEKELLLAISRQESGFTADIASSANAVGIMQLIRPTAERFADGLLISELGMEEALRNPEVNIKLGSRYLKFLTLHYKSFWPGVYAGYNAGEYAVDTWLKRRGHSDPLMFVELVPFGETKDYIKNVWRNLHVYKFLEEARISYKRPQLFSPALDAPRTVSGS